MKQREYKQTYSLKPKYNYVVIEIPYNDRIALAAAWGIMASMKVGETYRVMSNKVAFRMTNRRYREWIDIIKSVQPEEKENDGIINLD